MLSRLRSSLCTVADSDTGQVNRYVDNHGQAGRGGPLLQWVSSVDPIRCSEWRTVSGEPWVIREWTPNLRGSGLRNALQPLGRFVSLRGDLRPNAGKRYRGGPAVIYGGLFVILALLVTKAGRWTLPGAISIALVIGTSRLTLDLHTGQEVAAGVCGALATATLAGAPPSDLQIRRLAAMALLVVVVLKSLQSRRKPQSGRSPSASGNYPSAARRTAACRACSVTWEAVNRSFSQVSPRNLWYCSARSRSARRLVGNTTSS